MNPPLYMQRPTAFELAPAAPGRSFAVNDFIVCSEGMSNAYAIQTDAGRVIVNTGMGFEAPAHRENFDAATSGPVRFIMFTQSHVDHVGGTDLFTERGTEIVAQENNALCQADDARIGRFRASRSAFAFREAVARGAASIRGDAPVQSRPTPTITFRDRYDFELGGVQFELYAVPGGETIDSTVVWLPQHRIAMIGNVFGPLFPHVANLVTIRGDRLRMALPYIAALDQVIGLAPEVLVTGHFQPIQGAELIRQQLMELREGMQYVHDETIRGMNEGRSVEELMAEIELPKHLASGEGYGLTRWNVRAIWEGYAGWFHGRSTTELYSTPPSAVHEDLVRLAGGADRIAEAAQQRLANGEAVEAIHLCEVALTASAAHERTLTTYVAAHEHLLESQAQNNFWLTRWIEREIGRARSALKKIP